MKKSRSNHIRLTSHPSGAKPPEFPIHWGASSAQLRGPVIGSTTAREVRNVIGGLPTAAAFEIVSTVETSPGRIELVGADGSHLAAAYDDAFLALASP